MKFLEKVKVGFAVILSLISTFLFFFYVFSLYNSLKSEVRSDYLYSIFDSAELEEVNAKTNLKKYLFLFVELFKRPSADAIKNALDKEDVSYLEVKALPQNLRKLASDVPFSGREAIPVEVKTAEGWERGELKYRGDSYYHWGFEKKSYSLVLNDGTKYNLINVKNANMIADEVAMELAKNEFGLLTPESKWTGLFINDNFKEIFTAIQEVDDRFAKENELDFGLEGERMSFSFTSGNGLFFDSKKWDLELGILNEDNKNDFDDFLYAIHTRDYKSLFEAIDPDYFVKFYAWVSLIQNHIYDATHNWKLGYRNEKFYPIVWDPSAWLHKYDTGNGVEEIVSPISRMLRTNAYFNQLFVETLWRFANSSEVQEATMAYIDSNKAQLQGVLDYDLYKGGAYGNPNGVIRFPQATKSVLAGMETLRDTVKARLNFLKTSLAGTSVSYMEKDGYLYVGYRGLAGATLQDASGVEALVDSQYVSLPDISGKSSAFLVSCRVYESRFYATTAFTYYRVPLTVFNAEKVKLVHSLTGEVIAVSKNPEMEPVSCSVNFDMPYSHNKADKKAEDFGKFL